MLAFFHFRGFPLEVFRSPIFWICLIYTALGVVGGLLYAWRIAPAEWSSFSLPAVETVLFGAGVTLGTVFLVVGGNLLVLRHWRALQRAQFDLVEAIGQPSLWGILALGFFSAVGEEIFFRAYLQRDIGLLFSSLIFGLVHVPPKRSWWAWPIFAALMGLLLGWLHAFTQSLLLPILLHGAINALNFAIAVGFVRQGHRRGGRSLPKPEDRFDDTPGPAEDGK